LAAILVGEEPASHLNVKNKRIAFKKAGMRSVKVVLPADAGQEKLLAQIEAFNTDDTVDGILCQLPLPSGFDYDEDAVTMAIRPEKDVDCFHPENVGLLTLGSPRFLPCTPHGVLKLIEAAGVSCEGKSAVVLGRSNIVGKPMALLLTQRHATVTVCHSRTKELPALCKTADIVVAAMGRAEMVTDEWIKPGAVVLDVGINRNDEGKLVGDVHYESVAPIAGAITPVPGGVGPMTIAMLLENTVTAAKLRNGISE
jgi:methylenetetrahydrofolate dehydrogenase (NADP+)/methenyltetrahydrofolate cyclohydrolase